MLNPFTRFFTAVGLFTLSGCAMMPSLGPSEADEPSTAITDQAAVLPSGQAVAGHQAVIKQVPVPDVKARNQEKFTRALQLMQADDWAIAEQMLSEITQDQPELAGPWVNLALSQLALGDRDRAQASLAQALVANPYNCDALNQLGMLAREAGEFSQAEEHYTRCIEANPTYLAARLNLGILYDLYMGRYGEALAVYQDYQLARSEPDPRVNGWLLDLERRVAALAQR